MPLPRNDPFVETGVQEQSFPDSPPEITDDLPDYLTDDQEKAGQNCISFLNGGAQMISLTGAAGTGKTTLAQEIAKAIAKSDRKVAAVAPTHMAADQFEMSIGEEISTRLAGSGATTIQSALGLQLTRGTDGDYYLAKENEMSLPPSGIIIADEASQVGRDLWPHVEHVTQKFDNLQWLFLGDWAQLPPINEEPSPALKQDGPHLTEIIRQKAGNPIIRASQNVRENGNLHPRDEMSGQQGTMTLSEEKFLEKAVDVFKKWDDPMKTRVLAFRNRTVNQWAEKIRARLFPDADKPYTEDMWIIAQEAFSRPNEIGQTLRTSELLKVKGVERSKVYLGGGDKIQAWEITAYSKQGEKKKSFPTPKDPERYEDLLETRKTLCKTGEKDWSSFYDALEKVAKVRLAYATTVHKAQGSTIDTVFLDLPDISSSPDKDLIQPLKYVGCTRPSKRLVILKNQHAGDGASAQISNEHVPLRP